VKAVTVAGDTRRVSRYLGVAGRDEFDADDERVCKSEKIAARVVADDDDLQQSAGRSRCR